MSQQVRLGDLLGSNLEEDFRNFDLTEVQQVLSELQGTDPVDLAHAEHLQQQALRGADILAEYMAKMVKTVTYLESKVNSVKNKVSLEYQAPDGSRTTVDMKKWAAECSPDVSAAIEKLADAKGGKVALERKFDIIVKAHHHYKDIASGLRKTILGYSSGTGNAPGEGYD
jgi:hypothetical protein